MWLFFVFGGRFPASKDTIAKPELMYPGTTPFKSTRPPGSVNPTQLSTGHSNSGFALRPQRDQPFAVLVEANQGEGRQEPLVILLQTAITNFGKSELESTPMCALAPKNHWFPLRV